MSSIVQSVRHAIRRLLRAPAFSAAAVLTLTLGIGATTAVFSVVNAVLLRPLPYARPDRLVDLSHTITISGASRIEQSDATFLYYRRANRLFTDIGAYRVAGVNLGRASNTSSNGDTQSERVSAGFVSASTFRVFGVTALVGRTFRDDEDLPTAPRVVIIGQRLWERMFGGDRALVGRQIEIDGVPREVVGIMPARFDLPSVHTDIWVPIGIDPAHTATAAFDYRGVGRLRDGVSLDAAAADLQRLLPHVPEAFPGRLTAQSIVQIRMRAVVLPLRDVVVGDVGRVLWVVLGAVACVLLVACANVMNLFLVRADGRQHELAVRRALGAGRGTLVRDLVVEGAVLAVVGGTLALAVAVLGVRVLRSLDGVIDVPRLGELGVDGTVLAVAAGVTVLATLLVSLIPAVRAASTHALAALNETSRGLTAARGRQRVRHALVVAQMALALVLLTGAGLMVRSFARLRSVPSGIDAAHAFAFRMALPKAVYSDPSSPARFIVRAVDAASSVPGVQVAGIVSKLPLIAESRRDTALFVEDKPLAAGTMPNLHQVVFASPDYFRAMGVPVLEGRTFEPVNPTRAVREVILSRSVAKRYWPRDRAVGKRVRMTPAGEWQTVVGVVGDVRGTALEQPPDEIVYLPVMIALGMGMDATVIGDSVWSPREFAVVARTDREPAIVGRQVEAAVRALDPQVPAYGARAMSDVVAQASARTSLTLLLLGVASGVALALGAVGIYGVVAYVVSLRTREIAVRMALGARPADVSRMISRQAAVLVALGIVVGLAGAVALTRVLRALLFGVDPVDPLSMAAAAVVLAVVAAVASWVPARRAAGLDPAQALRA